MLMEIDSITIEKRIFNQPMRRATISKPRASFRKMIKQVAELYKPMNFVNPVLPYEWFQVLRQGKNIYIKIVKI